MTATSAAMEAAASATVEATASTSKSVGCSTAATKSSRYAATGVAAGHAAASIPTPHATCVAVPAVGISTVAVTISTAAAIVPAATVAPTTAAPAMTPAPAVPRTSADEDAAVKPVRTVVAIRGTGIGVIGVVAPFAVRRAVIAVIVIPGSRNDCWADAYSYRDLGIRHDGAGENHKHC